jgi:hypothetical protein
LIHRVGEGGRKEYILSNWDTIRCELKKIPVDCSR